MAFPARAQSNENSSGTMRMTSLKLVTFRPDCNGTAGLFSDLFARKMGAASHNNGSDAFFREIGRVDVCLTKNVFRLQGAETTFAHSHGLNFTKEKRRKAAIDRFDATQSPLRITSVKPECEKPGQQLPGANQ
jgi:hypothetical protein